MTPSEMAELRRLAEAAVNTGCQTCVRFRALCSAHHPALDRFNEAANPQTVLGLLDEIDRLRRDRDSYANSDFERQLDEARQQLAAMTAARDEACALAINWMSDEWRDSSTAHEHIAALRKVGGQ